MDAPFILLLLHTLSRWDLALKIRTLEFYPESRNHKKSRTPYNAKNSQFEWSMIVRCSLRVSWIQKPGSKTQKEQTTLTRNLTDWFIGVSRSVSDWGNSLLRVVISLFCLLISHKISNDKFLMGHFNDFRYSYSNSDVGSYTSYTSYTPHHIQYDISADYVDSTTAYDPRPGLDSLTADSNLMASVVSSGKDDTPKKAFPHTHLFLFFFFK